MADNNNDNSNKTILDYFLDNVEKYGDRHFMTQPMGGDDIQRFTFQEVLTEAKKMAAYIESLGLPPKSHIAICSKNCAWWIFADLAIWFSGHVSIPVFPTLTKEVTQYTLEHSEAKFIFIGKIDTKSWVEMKDAIPKDMPSVALPLCPKDHGADKTWEEAVNGIQPLKYIAKRTRDEMATIIYTSGSTGKPKGVMTSFGAMTDPCIGITELCQIKSTDRYLSYLPIAHGMERWLGECLPMYCAFHLYYAESLSTFVADLNRCRPTVFMSVPRLWTKFQAGVFQKIPQDTLNILLKIPLLNRLISYQVLKGLGLDQCRLAGSGSAPIPKELLEWYHSLGLELNEGYGMTENFNYSHTSRPGHSKAGYVGVPYHDVEQRIAADGEIQVRTPGKMMGYYKNAEADKEALTEDGWVRTGDKGELDEEGRLKITGRTKEIFKTAKGKYVAPAPIENILIANGLVELACVSGHAQPQPFALIQLSEGPKTKALANAEDRQLIEEELSAYVKAEVNSTVEAHEKLAFVAIVKDDWIPENGFLTPTQKIKRGSIEEFYAPMVEGWYTEKKPVIWVGDW